MTGHRDERVDAPAGAAPAPITVRDVGTADLAGIARLHVAAFPDSVLGGLGPEAVRRSYDWQLNGPHDLTALVASGTNGPPAGFLFGGVFRGSTIGFVKKERLFLVGRVLRHPLVLSRSVGWNRVGLGVRLLLRRRVPPQAEAPALVPSRSFGVLAIAVDPGTQGRGVGRLLMAEASERAQAQGFTSMHLTVHPGNAQALRFYRDLGWTEVAEPSGEWRGRMRISLQSDPGEPGSTD